jgi:serine/threonine protein kinase
MTLHALPEGLSQDGHLPATDIKERIESNRPESPSIMELAEEVANGKNVTPNQASLLCKGKWKGLVLAEYTLLDVIGTGGMGLVFQALHRRMDRVVALKVLTQQARASPDAVQRFQREVQAAAKLTHPNIVTAYDAGEQDGLPYLVMEYIEGRDLARRVRAQGPLPVAEAVDCILQAARGLEHAHGKGVIHRDIKPSNLLVDAAGTVKILDLGLARFLRLPSCGRTAESSGLSEGGMIVGTADYMAPEQALDAATADHRADIYSLGCTFYCLLAGKPLYSLGTAMQRLLAHRESPIPSLREARPEVTEDLDTIFPRMVAKEPQDRFSSMAEVIAALTPCLARQPQPALVSSVAVPEPRPGKEATEALGPTQVMAGESPAPARTRPQGKWPRGGTVAITLSGLLASVLLLGVVFKANTPEGPMRNLPQPEVGSREDGSQNAKIEPGRAGPRTPATAVRDPGFEAWMEQATSLPAEQQAAAVTQKLQDLNPGFDGKVEFGIDRGVVTRLAFLTDNVKNLAPVRALTGLKGLGCNGSAVGKGRLFDLSPLKGMRLKGLSCGNTRVSDLSPLKETSLESLACNGTGVSDLSPLGNLKLKTLYCGETRVTDLTPLKDMPLTLLHCGGAPVADLTPLKGMKLNILICGTKVKDLSPLKGMPLRPLCCAGTLVSDLSPLRGMALEILNCNGTQVTDLSPLEGMSLKDLTCTVRAERDTEILRSIQTLKRINSKPASEFWEEVGGKKGDNQR